MYMQVEFSPRNKRTITRVETVEVRGFRTKNLTDEQNTYCENKAISLCKKGERVLGWKILESYEINEKEMK